LAEIHDIEKERDRRMVEQMMKDVQNWTGFKIDFDICSIPIQFTGSGSGEQGKPEQNRIRIIAYDTSGPAVQPFGAIRMTRVQWEEFKKLGDGLLNGLAKVPE